MDQTGRPGPATWVGGDFPQGTSDHPVSGVSWYEAAAYAEYAGMRLPTSEHWNVARGGLTPMIQWPQLGGFGVVVPFSNLGSPGPGPVGSLGGVTACGAYDMQGNVREWCWNETGEGCVVRGGAWEDNTYESGNERQAPPMDRSPVIAGAVYVLSTVAVMGVIPAERLARSTAPFADAASAMWGPAT